MTTTKLTRHDVADCLNDDRHLGFGLAEASVMTSRNRERLFAAVARRANDLSLTKEELFHWTNSKHGRWLVDSVYGCGEPVAAAVASHMTAERVAEVQES